MKNKSYLLVPEKEKALIEFIENSIKLLNDGDRFSDVGAKEIFEKTLFDALGFLVGNYLALRKLKRKIQMPELTFSKFGHIDLNWYDEDDTQANALIVSVKKRPSQEISFCFDNVGGDEIKGTITKQSLTNPLLLLVK
jgi:hypothetical protein